MKQGKPFWIPAIVCLLIATVCNEWILDIILQAKGITITQTNQFAFGQLKLLVDVIGIFTLIHAGLFFRGKRLTGLLKSSGAYWFLLFVTVLLLIQITNPVLAGRFTLARLSTYGFGLFLLAKWFQIGVLKNKKVGNFSQNGGALVFMLLFLWLTLDSVFLFIPGTHNTIESLASRIWFHRYWKVNSLGYRDVEWNADSFAGKKSILLVGDSFTAGHGIKDEKDRFGNILEEKWGSGYQVLNLGTLGYGPELELENLQMFPHDADAVLIVWYVNDIHDAALKAGFSLDDFLGGDHFRPRTLNPIKTSYAVNYLYWLFPHPQTELNYTDFLKTAFSDSIALQAHFTALENLANEAQKRNLKVAALLFPMMADVKGSAFAIQPVKQFFHRKGIPALDISPLLDGKTARELMVSKNDQHPNEWVNAVVADTLDKWLKPIWFPLAQ